MILKNFNGYYQNARGLRTKSHMFLSQAAQSDYDFIAISETWLTNNFYDREYFDNRYNVYRCDRSVADSGAARGGGVVLAVRAEYRPVRRDWPVPAATGCECVWVSVALPSLQNHNLNLAHGILKERSLNIACVYIPHGPCYKELLISFFDITSQLTMDHPDDIFLIVGDFNVSQAEWVSSPSNAMNLVSGRNYASQRLLDFLCFTDLKQYNCIFNSYKKILDLIFCSVSCKVRKCDKPLVAEDALYHKALLVDLELNYTPRLAPSVGSVFNFHSANYEQINSELLKINWYTYFSDLNCEASVAKFYTFLNSIIKKYVPRRKLRSSSKLPAWHNASLKKILN